MPKQKYFSYLKQTKKQTKIQFFTVNNSNLQIIILHNDFDLIKKKTIDLQFAINEMK